MDSTSRVLVRMPKELHEQLSLSAQKNDVSLNQYIVFLLSFNEATRLAKLESNNVGGLLSKTIKEELPMAQDANSGRRGNEVGRLIGKTVAEKLGIDLEKGSNKGLLEGKKVVIKSARLGNSRFGITNNMLEEGLDEVILAVETTEGKFDLYKTAINDLKDKGTPTRSKGPSRGKVTNFKVSDAISLGKKFDSIKIDLPYPPNSKNKGCVSKLV